MSKPLTKDEIRELRKWRELPKGSPVTPAVVAKLLRAFDELEQLRTGKLRIVVTEAGRHSALHGCLWQYQLSARGPI